MEEIEQRQPMPAMHPDVEYTLSYFSPGDFALLPLDIAPLAMMRFLRLQLMPYQPYAETDARWIMQAWRNKVTRDEQTKKKGDIRDWFAK